MSRHGSDQGVTVLADLGVPPPGEGNGFAALGGDLLIGHRPARLALGGADQVADFSPFLHVADHVQRGVVHLSELIDLQRPLENPGEAVDNVAVASVESVFSLCHQVEIEVPVPVMGRPVQQGGIQTEGNALSRQSLVDHVPGNFRPRPDGREDYHPGVNFVGGEVKPGTGVHDQHRLLLRLVFLFLVVLAPVSALGRLCPGAAHAFQGGLKTGLFLLQKLRRQNAVLIHQQPGIGQGNSLLPAEFMELEDGVVRGKLQM